MLPRERFQRPLGGRAAHAAGTPSARSRELSEFNAHCPHPKDRPASVFILLSRPNHSDAHRSTSEECPCECVHNLITSDIFFPYLMWGIFWIGGCAAHAAGTPSARCRSTSLLGNSPLLGPYSGTMPRPSVIPGRHNSAHAPRSFVLLLRLDCPLKGPLGRLFPDSR